MHQSLISNGKDISRRFGLKLKMTAVPYFVYIWFHTYLKLMKLFLLETRRKKLWSKKKRITQNEGQTWKLWPKQIGLSTGQPRNPGGFLLPRTETGPLAGELARFSLSESFST